MAIETIDNFNIFVGRNIDNRYGPYANEGEANLAIDPIFRFKGLTVLLTGSGNQIEYWYVDGIADNDLKPKTAAIFLTGSDTHVVFFSGSTQISGSPSITYDYTNNHFFVTGSATLSGSTFLPGINDTSQQYVLTYNPVGGQVYYTSSNALSAVSTPLDIKDEGNPVIASPTFINFTGSGVSASVNGAGVDVYIPGGGTFSVTGLDGQVIFFSSSTAISGSPSFIFDYEALVPIFNVSGAISASYGDNSIGFYGTASWAESASNALLAQTSSFITASNVWGPFGSSSIFSASYASSSTFSDTASFITASNVWGPFGSSSVFSASYASSSTFADTASFITASNVWGPFGSSSVFSASYASSSTSASYAATASAAPLDTYIQYNENGLFGAEQYFRYIYTSHSLQHGFNSTAFGYYSHAQGSGSLAYGTASHAEGWKNTASGDYSHAEGEGNKVFGNGSHVEGRVNYISESSRWSHVGGLQNSASGWYQTIFGQNNKPILSQSAFIIGGDSYSAPPSVRWNMFVAIPKTDFIDPANSATPSDAIIEMRADTASISASYLYLNNLPSSPQSHILLYNTSSDQVYYTASAALGVNLDIEDEGNLVRSSPTFINFTGSNVTAIPNGTGVDVFVDVSAAATASFTNLTVWNFTHSLNSRYVVIQTLDTEHRQIIPEIIELVDTSSARITFPTTESGYAIATIGGAGGGGGIVNFNSTSSVLGNDADKSFDIIHNFGTRNLHITVYENSGNYETVYADISRPDINTVRVNFAGTIPPTPQQFVVYISQ